MTTSSSKRGSALIFALLVGIILAGMVGALSTIAIQETNVVLDTRQLESARLIAEPVLNLVVDDYQKDQAPPPQYWYQSPQPIAGGTYQILRDEPQGGTNTRRRVEIRDADSGKDP